MSHLDQNLKKMSRIRSPIVQNEELSGNAVDILTDKQAKPGEENGRGGHFVIHGSLLVKVVGSMIAGIIS